MYKYSFLTTYISIFHKFMFKITDIISFMFNSNIVSHCLLLIYRTMGISNTLIVDADFESRYWYRVVYVRLYLAE